MFLPWFQESLTGAETAAERVPVSPARIKTYLTEEEEEEEEASHGDAHRVNGSGPSSYFLLPPDWLAADGRYPPLADLTESGSPHPVQPRSGGCCGALLSACLPADAVLALQARNQLLSTCCNVKRTISPEKRALYARSTTSWLPTSEPPRGRGREPCRSCRPADLA